MRLLAVFNIIYSIVAAPLTVCRTCQFYVPGLIGGKYEIGGHYGKCKKFMFIRKNVSEIEYTHSIMARQNENQCGADAKFYESRWHR